MGIDRRTFLTALSTGLLASLLPHGTRAARSGSLYLSARSDDDGRSRVSGFDGVGRLVFDLPLPARGHALAIHPRGHAAAVFARRPGTFAVILDLAAGAMTTIVESTRNRHFYGHGVFSPDGRLLYATENDYAAERGVIGLYDARDGFRRIGELPSHGIGPHEIRLLEGGETMAVANGGILTHPDLPRAKLNLPTMSPSLVYLNRRDGALLGRVRLAPELHQVSIRHLAVGPGNAVAIAAQYQGPAGDSVPLVGLHHGKGDIVACTAPDGIRQRMRQYCGSVAFDRSGSAFAVSSPRGNLVTFWESSGRYLSSINVRDGCGVAPGARPFEFLVSSGNGAVAAIETRIPASARVKARFVIPGSWDNHLLEIG